MSVATNIFPPAITGPPYALVLSLDTHLMFFCFPSWTLQSAGMFFSKGLAIFRWMVPPNIGPGRGSSDFGELAVLISGGRRRMADRDEKKGGRGNEHARGGQEPA